jgi:streptogramin lyase
MCAICCGTLGAVFVTATAFVTGEASASVVPAACPPVPPSGTWNGTFSASNGASGTFTGTLQFSAPDASDTSTISGQGKVFASNTPVLTGVASGTLKCGVAAFGLGSATGGSVQFDGSIGYAGANGPTDGNGYVNQTYQGQGTFSGTILVGTVSVPITGTWSAGTIPMTDFTNSDFGGLTALTADPSGAMWFAANNPSVVGEVDSQGNVIHTVTDPSIDNPQGMAMDGSGQLWVTNASSGDIDVIDTTNGTLAHSYQVPGASPSPWAITAGPDGNMWVTDTASNSIWQVSPTGGFAQWTDPTGGISDPVSITVGPDGALWFVSTGNDSVDRITTAGAISSYTASTVPPISGLLSIASQAGSLWVTNGSGEGVEQVTPGPSPTFNEISDGTNIFPGEIAAGPDGAVWYAEPGFGSPAIARLSPTDNVSTYFTDSNQENNSGTYDPMVIAAGSDGAMWYGNSGAIGRIQLPPTPQITVGPSSIPSTPGPVSYSVGVADGAGPVPSGSVVLDDGQGGTCTVSLDGNGTGSCDMTESLSGAPYSIAADYSGDDSYSSGQTAVTVDAAGGIGASTKVGGVSVQTTGGSSTDSVTETTYGSDPVTALNDGSNYFDVVVNQNSTYGGLTIQDCGAGVTAATRLQWYNAGTWEPVTPTPVFAGSCVTYQLTTATATPPSSPTIGQLNGTVFGAVKATGLTVTTGSLPAATRGVSYGPVNLTASVDPSTSPYVTTVKWHKVSLPRGLKLSSSGVLSGTPSSKLHAGSSSITVQVSEKVTTLNGAKRVKTKKTIEATLPLTIG